MGKGSERGGEDDGVGPRSEEHVSAKTAALEKVLPSLQSVHDRKEGLAVVLRGQGWCCSRKSKAQTWVGSSGMDV